MNTRFSYLYSDASNYKKHHEIVLAGTLRELDLCEFLRDGEFFIPHEIDLPELQDKPLTLDDHIWHTFGAVEPTTEDPTDQRRAKEFLRAWKRAAALDWNEVATMRRLGFL
ncbi:hypothetical protein [Alkalispirochaeta alkalica]|uniref:hypothetical protein n=1 Tax=Alkalispirochaeta alkalica TaxID=46356 RepID=UPI00036618DA|nr:hypothetical protein [Alkalispirochaeta alkalica]